MINAAGPILVAAVLDRADLDCLYLWMIKAMLANVLITTDFFSKTPLSSVLWTLWKVQQISCQGSCRYSFPKLECRNRTKWSPPFSKAWWEGISPSCFLSLNWGSQQKGKQACSHYCPQWLSSASLQDSYHLHIHEETTFQEQGRVFISLTGVALPQQ